MGVHQDPQCDQNHTKEKKHLKLLTLHFAILPFSLHILRSLESTSLDETIRFTSKWFILAKKSANFRVLQSQLCYLYPINVSLS